jgi:PAS domain S-box-containing protein
MQIDKSLTNDILDSIGEGLFTVDKDFKINYFNRAAEQITGHKREDVIGSFCKHVFKSNRCFKKCPIAQVLELGKNIYDWESSIRNKNGTITPIKLNAAVLKNDGDKANFMALWGIIKRCEKYLSSLKKFQILMRQC